MKKITTILALCLASCMGFAQIITTVAGNGTSGYSGNGGQATAAQLNSPKNITFDVTGNMYITDAGNNLIRMVNTTGIITIFAGGNIICTNPCGDNGPATGASLYSPYGITFDDLSGNLYVSATAGAGSNDWIRKVNPANTISNVITSTTGNMQTEGIVFYNGYLYMANANIYNSTVNMVNSSGIVSKIAGGGTFTVAPWGDGGLATAATLKQPYGVAFDVNTNNLYIADLAHRCIRMVDNTGIISTVAGNGTWGYSGDGGQATAAELALPYGVAVDAAGNLYIADTYNSVGRIRMVNTSGIISTIAGGGTSLGDGGLATMAQLVNPTGIAFDVNGNLYISDSGHNRIRMVTNVGQTTSIPTHNQAGVNIFSYGNAIITNGTIAQGQQLKVINTLGQVVLTTALQSNIETNLPSGIYTIQVIDNTGSIIEIKKCALITQ
ncbi:MAG TPA: T9SS type A sorting domain-containing protein [Bacteroidia bacterium]